jgi:hypothetical protein
LKQQVERAKTALETRLSVKLTTEPHVTEGYPDLFELWTLINTIEAVTSDDSCEVYGFDSTEKGHISHIRYSDVRPSGRVLGATIDRVGHGLAPTLTAATASAGTSIWFDKYVGVSLDGSYWPRPDIVIRYGTYDRITSVNYETHAKGATYSAGYEIRRGRSCSEKVRGWRSLSELLVEEPRLGDCSGELVNNFKITSELVTVISNESGEPQAFAGQPLEALPFDGEAYAHGEILGDSGTIYWARRLSFLRPDVIIECKSGLLTPHALKQVSAYAEVFPFTLLIVATTRLPDSSVFRRFSDLGVRCITPPDTLRTDFRETLGRLLREARRSQ